MPYCPKCGNTGTLVDGSPCKCRLANDVFYDELVGVDVPTAYQGVRFNQSLVPRDVPSVYAVELDKLHTDITTLSLQNMNYCICSPAQHSKTVWAYSCIQNLFRQRCPVETIQEVLELRRMMYSYQEPVEIWTVPYLFVRVPSEVNEDVRATISTILERRVRHNGSTFFLYNGSWGHMTYGDSFHTLRDLQGDGSFMSFKLLNFPRPKQDDEKEVN